MDNKNKKIIRSGATLVIAGALIVGNNSYSQSYTFKASDGNNEVSENVNEAEIETSEIEEETNQEVIEEETTGEETIEEEQDVVEDKVEETEEQEVVEESVEKKDKKQGIIGNAINSETWKTATFSLSIENASIAYCNWHSSSDASSATLKTTGSGTLSVSDYTSNKKAGYIVFFVKPSSNYILTGLGAYGNGDMYVVGSGQYGNIASYPGLSTVVAKAQAAGYTAMFGFYRAANSTISNASVQIVAQSPDLEVSADCDKKSNVMVGDNLSFSILITPHTTGSGKDSVSNVNVTKVTINGKEEKIESLVDNKDGTYTATVKHVVTLEECISGLVTFETTAEVSYNGTLNVTIGSINTTATITKSSETSCTISTLKVVYNANGGDESSLPKSQVRNYSDPVSVSTTIPTRSGYTFVGWNSKADGTGKAYEAGKEYNESEDVQLFAQWEINEYTVKFVNEDGTVLQSEDLEYNSTPSYKGETPTKEKDSKYSYKFKGWDKDIDVVTEDTTYTATYEKAVNSFDVIYNANGGDESSVPESQTKTYDESLNLSEQEPTREGYEFKEWNTKADGSGTVYTAGSEFTKNEDTTLYAQWRKIDSTDVYVYAKIVDENGNGISTETADALGLTVNGHGYYTIGKVSGIDIPTASSTEKDNASSYKSKAIEGLGSVQRYTSNGKVVNETIDISSVPEENWTLSYVSSGADNYLGNGDCWHLDALIQVSTLRTVTVKYVDENGKEISQEKPSTGSVGNSVSESKIDITGYTYQGVKLNDGEIEDNTSYTYTFQKDTNNEVITFVYEANEYQYTVNYQDTTGKTIAASKTEDASFGTKISATNEKITITGYKYKSASAESITIGTGSNELTLVYEVDEEQTHTASYTIQFFKNDSEQKEDALTGSESGQVLSKVSANIPTITSNKYVGYTLDTITVDGEKTELSEVPATIETTSDQDASTTIKVFYKVDESKKHNVKYTIHVYKDGVEDTNALVTETSADKQILETATVTVDKSSLTNDKYDGYKLNTDLTTIPDSVSTTNTNTGTEENEYNVYYITDEEQTHTASYVINYYKGTQFVSNESDSKTEQELTTASVEINKDGIKTDKYVGYTLDYVEVDGVKTEVEDIPAKVETTSNDSASTTINVVYKLDETQTHKAAYTIKFYKGTGSDAVYQEGIDITDSDEAQVLSTASVDVDTNAISNNKFKGYKLDHTNPSQVPATVETKGTGNHEIVIQAYYVIDDSQTKDLSATIQYKLDGTLEESDTISDTVQVLQPDTLSTKDVEEKSFTGYTLTNITVNDETVTSLPEVVDNESVIVYNYTANDQTYTVQYVEKETGKVLDESSEINTKYGTTIKASDMEEKTFTGYTFLEFGSDITVGTENDKNVVYVYYSVNSYTVTVRPVDEEGTPIEGASNPSQTVDYLKDYSIQSPDVEGYVLDEGQPSTVKGTLDVADSKVIDVVYTKDVNGPEGTSDGIADKLEYHVIYDANGGEGTMEDTNIYPENYEVTLKENEFTRTGYTFSGWGLEQDSIEAVNTVTIEKEDVTVYAIWNINVHKITVIVQDEDGNPIDGQPPVTNTTIYNHTYKVTVPTIDGYTLISMTVNGKVVKTLPTVMGDEDVEIILVYAKDTVNPIIPETPETPVTPGTTTTTPEETPTTFLDVPVTEEDIEEVVEEETSPVAVIDVEEDQNPQAQLKAGAWALINLIMVIITGLLGIFSFIGKRKKEENEDDDTNKMESEGEAQSQEYKRRKWTKALSIVVFLACALAFFLTEDMSLPMVWTDAWTLLMVAIGAIQLVNLIIDKKWKKQDQEDNQEQEA